MEERNLKQLLLDNCSQGVDKYKLEKQIIQFADYPINDPYQASIYKRVNEGDISTLEKICEDIVGKKGRIPDCCDVIYAIEDYNFETTKAIKTIEISEQYGTEIDEGTFLKMVDDSTEDEIRFLNESCAADYLGFLIKAYKNPNLKRSEIEISGGDITEFTSKFFEGTPFTNSDELALLDFSEELYYSEKKIYMGTSQILLNDEFLTFNMTEFEDDVVIYN